MQDDLTPRQRQIPDHIPVPPAVRGMPSGAEGVLIAIRLPAGKELAVASPRNGRTP